MKRKYKRGKTGSSIRVRKAGRPNAKIRRVMGENRLGVLAQAWGE